VHLNIATHQYQCMSVIHSTTEFDSKKQETTIE